MLAACCTCARPQAFSETCNTCGRDVPQRVTASTWRLALAIAEVFAGKRPVGDQTGGHSRNTKGSTHG